MKILALTGDPSLEVAFSMIDEWDVISVANIAAALAIKDARVALIGMGGTQKGLEVVAEATEAGLDLPFVVVGDEEGPPDAPAIVVLRPFTLDDLQEAAFAAVASAEPATEPEPDPQPEEFERDAEQADASVQGSASVSHRPGTIPDTVVPEPELEGVDLAEVKPMPSRPSAPAEPEERPDLHVVPDAAPEQAAAEPKAAPAPAKEARPATQDEPEPARPKADADQTKQASPPARPEERTPEPEKPARPSAPPPPAQPAQPAQPAAAAKEKRGRFSRRKREPAAVADPLGGRLLEAAKAAVLIDDVLEELPMLADASALAEALVGELQDRFAPATAAVYLRRGKAFEVASGINLSPAESRLTVPEMHPLIVELESQREGILIAPVDLAQGMVAGIGGARTNAVLAAPVSIEGRCRAFLLVGRDDFSDDDLDACDALAREAAAGLTVALALDNLARRRSH